MVIDFSQSWLSTYYTSIGKKNHGTANRIVNRQLKGLSLRLSNTPNLSPMDEGHEHSDSPEVSSRNIQSIELRTGWNMSVNGRTPSDPMETGCRGKSISD